MNTVRYLKKTTFQNVSIDFKDYLDNLSKVEYARREIGFRWKHFHFSTSDFGLISVFFFVELERSDRERDDRCDTLPSIESGYSDEREICSPFEGIRFTKKVMKIIQLIFLQKIFIKNTIILLKNQKNSSFKY